MTLDLVLVAVGALGLVVASLSEEPRPSPDCCPGRVLAVVPVRSAITTVGREAGHDSQHLGAQVASVTTRSANGGELAGCRPLGHGLGTDVEKRGRFGGRQQLTLRL
jgi:hypothetical protein